MVVHVLQGVVLPHKHQVQAEGLEVHDAAALVLLPQFPQEVDRIILALLAVELQTKVREDVTIMEMAPTRAFSWLKAPTCAFTFKTWASRLGH